MSQKLSRNTIFQFLSLFFLVLTGILLIGLQYRAEGWICFILGFISLLLAERSFAKHMVLVYLSIGVLGFTPITTDTSISHMLIMGTALGIAVFLPYIIIRFLYEDDVIQYGTFLTRRWTRGEYIWLILTLIIGYFLIPYYLSDTLAYQNWAVEPGWWELGLLFLGTNALGIWDELFFVNTVLAILRRHFPFFLANLSQAVLFTAFLYELGFRGWGPFMIFPFAIAQGYVFRETKNLTYIISLHLILDLILFLALIHLHHPEWWVKVFF